LQPLIEYLGSSKEYSPNSNVKFPVKLSTGNISSNTSTDADIYRSLWMNHMLRATLNHQISQTVNQAISSSRASIASSHNSSGSGFGGGVSSGGGSFGGGGGGGRF